MNVADLQEADEIGQMEQSFKIKPRNRLRVCAIYIEQWEPEFPVPEEFK